MTGYASASLLYKRVGFLLSFCYHKILSSGRALDLHSAGADPRFPWEGAPTLKCFRLIWVVLLVAPPPPPLPPKDPPMQRETFFGRDNWLPFDFNVIDMLNRFLLRKYFYYLALNTCKERTPPDLITVLNWSSVTFGWAKKNCFDLEQNSIYCNLTVCDKNSNKTYDLEQCFSIIMFKFLINKLK